MKVCSKCGVLKPLTDFYRRGNTAISPCKPCNAMRVMAWREANPGGHARLQRAYRARHPERAAASVKAWITKHPAYEAARSARRWKSDPEYRARITAWGKAHPAAMLAISKNYQHRKRAADAGDVTPADILALLQRPCAYCGGRATEIDHVSPISRGGLHTRANLAPACRSCNSSKHSSTVEEWRTRKEAQHGTR